ncbi:MAG: hypothetical protein AB7O64_14165 [Methylibium sp.]
MKAFQPQVKVTLIKTCRRESLGTTVNAGRDVLPDMTRLGQFTELDLTPFLMDGGGVRTSKSVRDAAGTFSLTLSDRPVRGSSIYSLIEPTDIMEIGFARSPVARPSDLPVVMRGLVSAVSRAETIEGGHPQRAVQVAGHDFGKILQMLRIYYLPGSVVGEVWLDQFRFFRQYNMDAKIKPAEVFLEEVVANVINPYLQKVVAITQGRGLSVAVPKSFVADCSIAGLVSPVGVATFHGGSVYDLLSRFLDVGPFNELYVEDRGATMAVVCRPAPWRDLAGDYIDPAASAETVEVSDEDLMQINISRSDAGVANYFWCGNGSWELLNNGTLQLLAQSGNRSTYTAFDYINAATARFGLRKMEVESQLGDPLGLFGDGPAEKGAARERATRARWLDNRRRVLALSNRDNVVLEAGQLRLRGNEAIRAGQYIELQRGAMRSTQYAVTVQHEFLPAVGFFTTVDFERGTGFVAGQSRVGKPWFDERNEGGVS